MQVQSLGWEDSLEEGMATLASVLASIPMDRGAWRVTAHGVTQSWTQLKQFCTYIKFKSQLSLIYLRTTTFFQLSRW